METAITVAAWFVAIPTSIIAGILFLQILMGILCKDGKLNITGYGWVLWFLMAGLSWGWIAH